MTVSKIWFNLSSLNNVWIPVGCQFIHNYWCFVKVNSPHTYFMLVRLCSHLTKRNLDLTRSYMYDLSNNSIYDILLGLNDLHIEDDSFWHILMKWSKKVHILVDPNKVYISDDSFWHILMKWSKKVHILFDPFSLYSQLFLTPTTCI